MAKFSIKLLLAMVCFVDHNRACEEILAQEVQHVFTTNNRYYFKQPYVQRKTTNSTIICSNVASAASLDYNVEEKPYPQYLEVTNSTISLLPSLTFEKFPSVTKLFLKNLHIKNILPGAFTGPRNLQELYLDHNKMTELASGIYNSLHQLKILSLTHNKIQKIEKFSLMGLAKLEELHLKNNSLSVVGKDLLAMLGMLKYLDLSENPLVSIYPVSPKNLHVLKLSKTSLSKLSGNWSSLKIDRLDLSFSDFVEADFTNFPVTENLDLSHNEIVSVSHCELLKARNVKLSNNYIREVSGTFVGLSVLNLSNNNLRNLTNFSFNNTGKLQAVDFSYNKISTIRKNVFRKLDTLQQLHLQHNEIVKINTILLQDLTNLKVLNLSHNKIQDLQFGTFDRLSNLQILDISYNELTDLHQYTFTALSNLQFLHFENNKISSLNEVDLKHHLPRLQVVDLDKNLWQCKDLVQIYSVLQAMKVMIVPGFTFDVENFRGISCQNDNEVTGTEYDVEATSGETMVKNLQQSLDEAIKNSTLVRFFNEDFGNSSFFKFLNNYEASLEKREVLDEKYMEKLTSSVVQEVPENYRDKIFVAVVVVQVIVLALLLLVVCLILKYLKRRKVVNERKSISEFSELQFF